MSDDIDSSTSFAELAARVESLVARKKEQIKEEMVGFAAQLGLKDESARSANCESLFWSDQARRAGIDVRDGWDDESLQRLPEPIGARIQCIDAFYELTLLLRPHYAAGAGLDDLEYAREIDNALDILRSETPKAAPPPARGIFQAWLNRERVKERIEKLEEKLALLKVPGLVEGVRCAWVSDATI